ncbi:MAG: HD domain-containing protein [Bacteroidetes bacterium]|nr:HD domain-containing protein [Bacteroidota bacterium]MBS1629057.1 HD domain-containing protein [Bacteroidota bacterium]
MEFQKAKTYICGRLQEELPAQLSYHSLAHTRDVYQAAEHLARAEGLDDEARLLVLTAALYHDCGFMISAKNHEAISCEIATQSLPQFGYSREHTDQICGMIQATRIPQSPRNLSEEIIADADLDYLGREDFWAISDLLFQELKSNDAVQNSTDWNRLQVKFFEQHRYFTRTAIEMRAAQKEWHLTQLKAMVQE